MTLTKQILALMLDGRQHRPEQFAPVLGINPHRAKNVMSHMHSEGYISLRRKDVKAYCITMKGRAKLEKKPRAAPKPVDRTPVEAEPVRIIVPAIDNMGMVPQAIQKQPALMRVWR